MRRLRQKKSFVGVVLETIIYLTVLQILKSIYHSFKYPEYVFMELDGFFVIIGVGLILMILIWQYLFGK